MPDWFNDPNFYAQVMKDAVIPVAKSDLEMPETVLPSEVPEEDEPLPFEEH